MSRQPEVVLLVQDGPTAIRFLPVVLTRPVSYIVERLHLTKDAVSVREWRCMDGERAPSGQRIFRQVVPPPTPDPQENPLRDELNLKKPLPFMFKD